jgi:hypothetical protein
VGSVIDALLGGILGSVLTMLYMGALQWHEASGRRSQIVFLLRQLQIHMGMIRDFPRHYYHDVRLLVTRLNELSLTTLSASGLSSRQREAVFLVIYDVDEAAAFLDIDRDKLVSNGEFEYIRASAAGTFSKLQGARESLNDSGTLVRPPDRRTLHTWRSGEPIPGSTVS